MNNEGKGLSGAVMLLHYIKENHDVDLNLLHHHILPPPSPWQPSAPTPATCPRVACLTPAELSPSTSGNVRYSSEVQHQDAHESM